LPSACAKAPLEKENIESSNITIRMRCVGKIFAGLAGKYLIKNGRRF